MIVEPTCKKAKYAKTILNQLQNELKKRTKDNKEISFLENQLSEHFEYLITFDEFYSLPMDNINHIITNVNFESFDDYFQLLKTFLTKLSKTNEDSILILKSIQCLDLELTQEQCMELVSLFNQYELINKLATSYEIQRALITPDYQFRIEQQEKQIKEMKEFIDSYHLYYAPKLKEKPIDFEPNIYKACIEGKFTSVQYLIEK